jgi:uncharacterized RDD family membrane protein YckC
MEPSLRETSTLVVRPPPLPHRRRPVGFTAHIAAFLFDALALLALPVAGGLIVGLVGAIFPRLRPLPESAVGLFLVGVILLCTVGDIVVDASPGKWIFGLAIRRPTGERAPLGRLVLRWLLKYAPLLLLAVRAGAGFFGDRMGLWDAPAVVWLRSATEEAATCWAYGVVTGTLLALLPARRTLHDLAGTAVYSVPVRRSELETATLQRGFEVAPLPTVAAAETPAPAPSDSPS